MTKVEMTIKEDGDGYQLNGTVYATKDAAKGELDIANLLSAAIQNFVDGIVLHMQKNTKKEERQ
jgi:hypothetical protein